MVTVSYGQLTLNHCNSLNWKRKQNTGLTNIHYKRSAETTKTEALVKTCGFGIYRNYMYSKYSEYSVLVEFIFFFIVAVNLQTELLSLDSAGIILL